MRGCLHTIQEDDVISVNGLEYAVEYVQKNNNSLTLSIMLYSGSEIICTPRKIEIFHPDTSDMNSSKFDTRTVKSSRKLE